MTAQVHTKRVYQDADRNDGYRVFVDRLWPRGLAKASFKYDQWCKDLAPSPALRNWFGHKLAHWDGFKESYQSELRTAEQKQRMLDIKAAARQRPITLVYGAKDTEHNHAIILAQEMNRAFSHDDQGDQ